MSATEEQILQGLTMVRRMAARYRRTPLGAEDAYGVGAVALVEAGRRYRPHHGVPFDGYAYFRVRGAMSDACRSARYGGRADRETPHDPDTLCEVADLRARHHAGRLDLLAAVAGLRCRLRTVLLRHACGVPHRQIAADMGVTESRVSQLLGMARAHVRAEAEVRLD